MWQPFNMIDPLIAVNRDWLEAYREIVTPLTPVNRKREVVENQFLQKLLESEDKDCVFLSLMFHWMALWKSKTLRREGWTRLKLVYIFQDGRSPNSHVLYAVTVGTGATGSPHRIWPSVTRWNTEGVTFLQILITSHKLLYLRVPDKLLFINALIN